MNMRIITIVLAIALAFVLAIAVALMTGSRAAEAEVAPAFRSSNYGWYWGSTPCEECRRNREIQRRRKAREWRRQQEYRERHEHRHTRKVWRDHREYVIERDDDRHEDRRGRRCYPEVAAVGDQYVSEDGARSEAQKAWAQTVRYMHGERVMSYDNAKDVRYECGRSSVGSVAGQIFYRCRITGIPCSAAPQRAN